MSTAVDFPRSPEWRAVTRLIHGVEVTLGELSAIRDGIDPAEPDMAVEDRRMLNERLCHEWATVNRDMGRTLSRVERETVTA